MTTIPADVVTVPVGAATDPTSMKMEAIDTLTGDGELPHSGREARNLAEKHRRDKLNASIQELATMVPHAVDSPRRLDKTAVLRFAAHGLRLKHCFGKSRSVKRSARIGNEKQPLLTDTLLQLLDSFFITLTCHGQIVLVSSSVEQLLGHCQSDLYGQNILNMTHPEDHELLRMQLVPRDMETLFRHEFQNNRNSQHQPPSGGSVDEGFVENEDITGSPSPRNESYLAEIDQRLRADRRCFTVRLARAGARTEAMRNYEIVKIDGCFRRSDFSTNAGHYPIVSQLIRRSRSSSSPGYGGLPSVQHDVIAQAALRGISGNDVILVAMARIIRPPKVINRLLDTNRLEYCTRHLIDGRIIDCDQRISLVAGYFKDEVRNLCPFTFMHQDDVRWVIVALRQMYDCNSNYGESCYRLLSRNGNFIYLQTKGYLEIDKDTNIVHSFFCVNTLLDEEEGRRKVQEMKNKFSIIIKTKIPSNSLLDVPASQNPQQLERIVLYLIENLQKRNEATAAAVAASPPSDAGKRFTSIPSLALVPPEPASVKNSISKSVNVVNVTAAKNLQYAHQRSPAASSSYHDSDISLSPTNSLDVIEQGSEAVIVNGNGCSTYGDTVTMKKTITVATSTSSMTTMTSTTAATETPTAATTTTTTKISQMKRPSVLKINPLPVTNTTTKTTTPTSTSNGHVEQQEQHQQQSEQLSVSTTTNHQKNNFIIINSNNNNNKNNGDLSHSSTQQSRGDQLKAKSFGNSTTVTTTIKPKSSISKSTPLPSPTRKLEQQISVLKRLKVVSSTDDTETSDEEHSRSPAKCRPILHMAEPSSTITLMANSELSTTLRYLDTSLQNIHQDARTLYQKCSRLPNPLSNSINQELGKMIGEHKKQKKIMMSINTENEVVRNQSEPL